MTTISDNKDIKREMIRHYPIFQFDERKGMLYMTESRFSYKPLGVTRLSIDGVPKPLVNVYDFNTYFLFAICPLGGGGYFEHNSYENMEATMGRDCFDQFCIDLFNLNIEFKKPNGSVTSKYRNWTLKNIINE